MNGPTRLAVGTEAEVRRIIREELTDMLAQMADVAYRECHDYDTRESSAMSAIEKVAKEAADRVACNHPYTRSWLGDSRCGKCGKEIPQDPGQG